MNRIEPKLSPCHVALGLAGVILGPVLATGCQKAEAPKPVTQQPMTSEQKLQMLSNAPISPEMKAKAAAEYRAEIAAEKGGKTAPK